METDMATSTQRLLAALGKPDPVRTLRAVVLELAAEGHAKRAITVLLEELLLDLRARPEHREDDEDAVLDVLDGLAGWCQDGARLLLERETAPE
jgi:hypothetical protein